LNKQKLRQDRDASIPWFYHCVHSLSNVKQTKRDREYTDDNRIGSTYVVSNLAPTFTRWTVYPHSVCYLNKPTRNTDWKKREGIRVGYLRKHSTMQTVHINWTKQAF